MGRRSLEEAGQPSSETKRKRGCPETPSHLGRQGASPVFAAGGRLCPQSSSLLPLCPSLQTPPRALHAGSRVQALPPGTPGTGLSILPPEPEPPWRFQLLPLCAQTEGIPAPVHYYLVWGRRTQASEPPSPHLCSAPACSHLAPGWDSPKPCWASAAQRLVHAGCSQLHREEQPTGLATPVPPRQC